MLRKPLARSLSLLLCLSALSAAPGIFAREPAPAPQIALQGFTFDPLAAEPALAADAAERPGPGPALYLVQFTGPVQEPWKAAAETAGARLYGYIPDYAFIARMDAAAAERVRGLPAVRWVGPYRAAYRLAEPLRAPTLAAGAGPVQLEVQTLPDADLDAVARQLADLGGVEESRSANAIAGYVRVLLPAAQAGAAAALPEVVWVAPYVAPQRLDERAAVGVLRADTVRQSLGLYGAGQVVGIADSGLDTGDVNNLHPDLAGRLIKAYCLGRPNPCDWSDFDGHGTHVAGSVLGSGVSSGSNPAARQYNSSYAGAAPEARYVFQSTGDMRGGLGGIPQDDGDLMRQAYADGARIHTNSWGGPTGVSNGRAEYGGYPSGSQQVDLAAWELKDQLIIFAAGNQGVDADGDGVVDQDSMAQPATAKNVLTVGASENNRPEIQRPWGQSYGSPIAGDLRADNPDGMAAFSSRGPTDDGRLKPDVVAPGTFIVSTRTRRFAFDDNLEGDTSRFQNGVTIRGGTAPWALGGPAHSGQRAFVQRASGSFQPGAATAFLLPAVNVQPIGGAFDIQFFHRYRLAGDDKLMLVLIAPSAQNPQETANATLRLNLSGSQDAYTFAKLTLSPDQVAQAGLDPRQLRVGFAITGDDGSYDSEWAVDDIRIDGSQWSNMGEAGLTQPGSAIDDSYLLMGGTSMATPLTAGAAAVAREWLQKLRGIASPSGALLKALLMNGATGMGAGQYGEGAAREIPATTPNSVNGWGRVNLMTSLLPAAPNQIWVADDTAGLATGQSRTFELRVGGGQQGGAAPEVAAAAATPVATPIATPVAATQTYAATVSGDDLRAGTIAGAPAAGLAAFDPSAAPRGLPAAPQQAGAELLANGGFEAGAWAPWQTVGAPALDAQVRRSGAAAARLGGRDEAADRIGQLVSVPAGITGASLRGYVAVASDEVAAGSDSFCGALLDPASGQPYASFCADVLDVEPNTWTPFALTLSAEQVAAVAGRQVIVAFAATTDFSLSSAVWFDDLSLQVAGGQPPVPTTPVPTTPVPTTPVPPGGSGGPLRLTLAWTDYPGQPAAARTLVNDLDVEVIAPDGTVYKGNAGAYPAGHRCLGQDGRDRCNNVETVFIPQAAPGVYTVVVRASQVAQGGAQPFALAGWGDSLRRDGEAVPAPPAPPPAKNVRVFLPLQRR